MSTSFLKDAESLVLELLAMPGVSGQEGEVVRFIAQRLRQAGAAAEAIRFDRPPHSSPIRGEAGNLVLRLPGSKPGKRRLLLAHVDTVPLCRALGRFVAGGISSRPTNAPAWAPTIGRARLFCYRSPWKSCGTRRRIRR